MPAQSENGAGREVLGDTGLSGYTGYESWRAPGEEAAGGPAGISEIQRSHYPGSVPEERAPCRCTLPMPSSFLSSQLIGNAVSLLLCVVSIALPRFIRAGMSG